MEIFINKKIWKSFTQEQAEEYADLVFRYYREHGFPYYPTDIKWRQAEFRKLKKYDCSMVLENKCLKQTMHGLGLAWSYFPRMWEVRCNGLQTPMEVFSDDGLFRKVIRKRMLMGDNMSDAGIRKMLKIFTGSQGVSNFRPTAACALYNRFAEGGTVWDMSCGWGGRLLGFLVSNAERYIGTDPSIYSYEGCLAIKGDFGDSRQIELHHTGSEDFRPLKESLDFCFTSPPYFDCEHYSDEISQSYLKFPTKNSWLQEFLKKTFENCFHGLKPGKFLAVNIADVRSFPDLEAQTVLTAQDSGFALHDKYLYLLSTLSLNSRFKAEPIFLFKKDS